MKKLDSALLLAALLLAVHLSMLPAATMLSLQGRFLSFLAPFFRKGTAVQEQIGSIGGGLETPGQAGADKVEGTREKGFLSGMRLRESGWGGQLQLHFLARNAPIETGEKVSAAGVSTGVFTSGILLGKVKEFRMRPPYGHALVEPSALISRAEDVFVGEEAK